MSFPDYWNCCKGFLPQYTEFEGLLSSCAIIVLPMMFGRLAILCDQAQYCWLEVADKSFPPSLRWFYYVTYLTTPLRLNVSLPGMGLTLSHEVTHAFCLPRPQRLELKTQQWWSHRMEGAWITEWRLGGKWESHPPCNWFTGISHWL